MFLSIDTFKMFIIKCINLKLMLNRYLGTSHNDLKLKYIFYMNLNNVILQ